MRASLLNPVTGVSMDQLDPAQIKKVDGGILVAGFEHHPGQGGERQTWWCVPVKLGRLISANASGFDPADD
jgi:hypothetical protein